MNEAAVSKFALNWIEMVVAKLPQLDQKAQDKLKAEGFTVGDLGKINFDRANQLQLYYPIFGKGLRFVTFDRYCNLLEE